MIIYTNRKAEPWLNEKSGFSKRELNNGGTEGQEERKSLQIFTGKSNSAYKDARLVFTDIQSDLSSNNCCNSRIMVPNNRLGPFSPAAVNSHKSHHTESWTDNCDKCLSVVAVTVTVCWFYVSSKVIVF